MTGYCVGGCWGESDDSSLMIPSSALSCFSSAANSTLCWLKAEETRSWCIVFCRMLPKLTSSLRPFGNTASNKLLFPTFTLPTNQQAPPWSQMSFLISFVRQPRFELTQCKLPRRTCRPVDPKALRSISLNCGIIASTISVFGASRSDRVMMKLNSAFRPAT